MEMLEIIDMLRNASHLVLITLSMNNNAYYYLGVTVCQELSLMVYLYSFNLSNSFVGVYTLI